MGGVVRISARLFLLACLTALKTGCFAWHNATLCMTNGFVYAPLCETVRRRARRLDRTNREAKSSGHAEEIQRGWQEVEH